MSAKRKLIVESIMMCEYASQDFQGRGIIAGAFPGVVNFDKEPQKWPQIFMYLVMQPTAEEFSFSVSLRGPEDKNVVTFQGIYKNGSRPDQRERIVFNGQIPPVKFGGPGLYTVEVKESRARVASYEFTVEVGAPLPIDLGHLEMEPPVMGDLF